MNVTQYAKHVERSVSLISRWLKPGGLLEDAHIRANGAININVKMADLILNTQLNKSQSRRKETLITKEFPDIKWDDPGESEFGSLADAMTRDKYYSAALKKQKLDQIAGTLTLKADEEKEAFECARQLRDTILNVPGRISSILAAETNAFEVDKLLSQELSQALETVITLLG